MGSRAQGGSRVVTGGGHGGARMGKFGKGSQGVSMGVKRDQGAQEGSMGSRLSRASRRVKGDQGGPRGIKGEKWGQGSQRGQLSLRPLGLSRLMMSSIVI